MAPEVLRFDSILDGYNARNETTYLDNLQYVWDAGSAADVSGFEVTIRVRIPPEQEFVFKVRTADGAATQRRASGDGRPRPRGR